jgi:hypothetical protein
MQLKPIICPVLNLCFTTVDIFGCPRHMCLTILASGLHNSVSLSHTDHATLTGHTVYPSDFQTRSAFYWSKQINIFLYQNADAFKSCLTKSLLLYTRTNAEKYNGYICWLLFVSLQPVSRWGGYTYIHPRKPQKKSPEFFFKEILLKLLNCLFIKLVT